MSAAGRRFVSEYRTLGPYDILEILKTFEAPDDQPAMAALLALGGLGNVRAEILCALSESEMASIF